jgi:hypothetical protein
LPAACDGDFRAVYDLTPVGLYLRKPGSNEENGGYPPSEGSDPSGDVHQSGRSGEAVPVSFTGKIRLARDFINQPRVAVAYQKAIAFRKVFDITLKEGQVVGILDRSGEMELKRDALKECCRFPDRLEKVLYAFSLDLDLE